MHAVFGTCTGSDLMLIMLLIIVLEFCQVHNLYCFVVGHCMWKGICDNGLNKDPM